MMAMIALMLASSIAAAHEHKYVWCNKLLGMSAILVLIVLVFGLVP